MTGVGDDDDEKKYLKQKNREKRIERTKCIWVFYDGL